MKTETEQLKENRDQQYAQQRMNEVFEYLEELSGKCLERLKWKMRATLWEMGVIVFHFALILALAILEIQGYVTHEFTNTLVDLSFMVFLVVAVRDWHHHSRYVEADGEFRGCLKTLQKLGMLETKHRGGNEKKKVKKESLAKRLKETWERLGIKKKKGQEAYA